jgi:hypothetical protein
MYKLPSKSQYQIGNDKQVPDSAFNASSYIDGIYTEFDKTNAPNGWADVQETFKMNLPQNKWEGTKGASSAFVTSGLFTDGYDTAKSEKVSEAFNLPESGRSTYVDGVDTKFPE